MAEFGGRRPLESWNPDTSTYKLTHTDFLARGIQGLQGIRDVSIDAGDSTVRIRPTEDDDHTTPRVITRVTARGESEEEARAAAIARYGELSVSRRFGSLSIESSAPVTDEDAVQAPAESPRPEVDSNFKVILPEREGRTYTIKTHDGSVLLTSTSGDAEVSTRAGDIFSSGQGEGSLNATTDSGRVIVQEFAGNVLDITTKDGDVFVNGVDEAALNIKTQSGPVKLHGAEVALPSHVETGTGSIEIGVTNDDLRVYAASQADITPPSEGFHVVYSDPRIHPDSGRIEETMYGTFGNVIGEERGLTVHSDTGAISIASDTGVERTLPLPPVDRDGDAD